jgi:hypothetical protein
MGFASPGGAEAAVTHHFAELQGRSLPPVPRLQMTAREEKFRRPGVASTGRPGTSGNEMFGSGLSSSVADRPMTVGHSVRPPLPKGVDLDKPVVVPAYTSYHRWFNDEQSKKHTVIGRPLLLGATSSLHTPRMRKNIATKADALQAIKDVLGHDIPQNMHVIVHTFLTYVPRLRSIDFTPAAFTDALRDLDVVRDSRKPSDDETEPQEDRHQAVRDESIIFADQLFQKFDVHKVGKVPLTTIVRIFDECINSDLFRQRVRRHCFELFNQQGYIHSTHLESMRVVLGKNSEFRASGATSDMVRVLGDVFLDARRQEEEDYINNVLLKKAKKKKKAPPLKQNQKSHVPVTFARIAHLDYDQFNRYFETNRELAAAFCPRWIRFMTEDPTLNHMVSVRSVDLAEREEAAAAAAAAPDDA